MGRDRGALYAALASTLLSVLLAIAVNVGTGGALPRPVAALAPLAWPLVGVFTVVTVWLAVAVRPCRPPPATRMRGPGGSHGSPSTGADGPGRCRRTALNARPARRLA